MQQSMMFPVQAAEVIVKIKTGVWEIVQAWVYATAIPKKDEVFHS